MTETRRERGSCGALLRRFHSLDVTDDAFADCLAELHGDGVSDKAADRFDINRFAFSHEFVVAQGSSGGSRLLSEKLRDSDEDVRSDRSQNRKIASSW